LKKLLNSALLTAVILLLPLLWPASIYGQQTTDSTKQKVHSPKKANLLALIPGAGQIYNKKYWKLPIVYAGFGVTGYFAFWNRGEYLKYQDAYICKLQTPENQLIVEWNPVSQSYVCSVDKKVECDNELAAKYSASDLKTFRDYYRRNMELSYILMGLWYILQMLDATVDAHLYYWNVDENLSVRLEPVIMQPNIVIPTPVPGNIPNHNGLKISVNF